MWWEEKGRQNCVVGGERSVELCGWEEKGRWNCAVGREK